MKLYGFWRSLATYRVRVALAFKGVAAPEISVNLLQGAQHKDDYKAVNPQSVVPALVVDEGAPLFQSLAILEYLEEAHPQPPLLPRDPRGRARVRGLSLVVACAEESHPLSSILEERNHHGFHPETIRSGSRRKSRGVRARLSIRRTGAERVHPTRPDDGQDRPARFGRRRHGTRADAIPEGTQQHACRTQSRYLRRRQRRRAGAGTHEAAGA